jgi:two-component system heavy metal sensor histidine kinase CusS
MALAAIALAIFFVTSAILDHDLMTALRAQEAAEVTSHFAMAKHYIQTRSDDVEVLRHDLDDLLESHPELRIWVAHPDGRVIYGGALPKGGKMAGGLLTLDVQGARAKGMRETLNVHGPLAGAYVIVAVSGSMRDRLMAEHRITLLAVSLLATAAIAGSTAWATRRGLAPIRVLSQEAARIRPDHLGRRLSVGDTALELHDLAQSFNAVLDRLEEAYDQLDAFNADVAHELRTPLATMINGTQVTLSSPSTLDEMRETLLSNLEELEDLKRLVNDMLFLARADRGARADGLGTVSLAAETGAVIDYFEAALHEAGIGMRVDGEARVIANGTLVRRAIANLLSNALRYTTIGGTIEVRLGYEAGVATVRVRNPGPAIAPDQIGRIFDRFFRVSDASSRVHEGSGLGLAIVRAIARMHGGDTFARSEGGLTEVGFTLGRVG